jgi:hypothetical protein
MSLHFKRNVSNVLAMFVFCIHVHLQLCIFVKIFRKYIPDNSEIKIDFTVIDRGSEN